MVHRRENEMKFFVVFFGKTCYIKNNGFIMLFQNLYEKSFFKYILRFRDPNTTSQIVHLWLSIIKPLFLLEKLPGREQEMKV